MVAVCSPIEKNRYKNIPINPSGQKFQQGHIVFRDVEAGCMAAVIDGDNLHIGLGQFHLCVQSTV